MQIFPSKSAFSAIYGDAKNTLLYSRLSADLDTAVSLFLKLTQDRKDSFMLESVTGGEIRGRYSIIGMDPDLIWRCEGTTSATNRTPSEDPDAFEPEPDDPLTALRRLLAASEMEIPDDLPPMAAGLYGYLGYDMIRLVEHLPDVNPDTIGLPDAVMMRPRILVIVDGVKDQISVCAPVWYNPEISADAAFAAAQTRLQNAVSDLDGQIQHALTRDASEDMELGTSNFTKPEYFEVIDKAKEYIKAGDIFQVVPSQRWSMDFPQQPFAFYRALRRTNPSPYMFYFNFGDFQVVGASPEILVRVEDDEVTIRPIAGTRPRGKTETEDQALEADLLADKKELAEHLMLLDLGRNDVGRVAKIGTVDPNEQFIIERYSHVMHIVSNVVGQLDEKHDALSALLAGLPAGTVSGAPKVRAMEIIDELETVKRVVYGGGVGYFSAQGDMDICIALRTAVIKEQTLYIQAGGGVVYDSDPEAEFQETVNKSNALRRAAALAPSFNISGKN
ncbi:MAG: anthranilate synthase component I [Pseudomonadota bacterium]